MLIYTVVIRSEILFVLSVHTGTWSCMPTQPFLKKVQQLYIVIVGIILWVVWPFSYLQQDNVARETNIGHSITNYLCIWRSNQFALSNIMIPQSICYLYNLALQYSLNLLSLTIKVHKDINCIGVFWGFVVEIQPQHQNLWCPLFCLRGHSWASQVSFGNESLCEIPPPFWHTHSWSLCQNLTFLLSSSLLPGLQSPKLEEVKHN